MSCFVCRIWYVVCRDLNGELRNQRSKKALSLIIFSFLPRSPHEIACPLGGTAGISQGKSAKNEKFERKNAKKRRK